MGRRLAGVLAREGVEVLAFSDSDPSKRGAVVEGLQVLSPQEAATRFGRTAMFVVAKWSPGDGYLQVEAQLRGLGVDAVMPLPYFMWRYPDVMLPHYLFAMPDDLLAHRDEIAAAYALLADDESRRQFAGQLEWRLTLDYRALVAPLRGQQYFVPGLVQLGEHARFVDCGAFDGDTLRTFLDATGGHFDGAVAFEPDPRTFARLEAFVASLPPETGSRIVIRKEATGDEACVLYFEASGGTDARASADDAGVPVPCVRLDDVVERATYIKMDIEGGEEGSLRGASRLIRDQAPDLAICLYHRPGDFYRIPLLMRELDPTSSIHCRGHEVDGLDLVAYAVHR
jgi:FkbM family methyltransferase